MSTGPAPDGKGEAATVAQGQRAAAGEPSQRPGQLGVRLTQRLDGDAGRAQELTNAADVDLRVDELPDDLREVDGAQRGRG